MPYGTTKSFSYVLASVEHFTKFELHSPTDSMMRLLRFDCANVMVLLHSACSILTLRNPSVVASSCRSIFSCFMCVMNSAIFVCHRSRWVHHPHMWWQLLEGQWRGMGQVVIVLHHMFQYDSLDVWRSSVVLATNHKVLTLIFSSMIILQWTLAVVLSIYIFAFLYCSV